jgi:phage terminase small subunit
MMTTQQQAVADAVLRGESAEQAAILAGYAKKSARTTGPRVLRMPVVAEYIAAQRQKQSAKELSRREKILAELDKMAFANIGDLVTIDANGHPQVDFSRATPEQLAAVTSVATKRRVTRGPKGEEVEEQTAKFSMADKYRGLELLGRAEGMFKENEVKVTVDVADRLLAARQRLAALPAPGDEDE